MSDVMMVSAKNLLNDVYCRDASAKIQLPLSVKRGWSKLVGSLEPYGCVHGKGSDRGKPVVNLESVGIALGIFDAHVGVDAAGIAVSLNEWMVPIVYEHFVSC